MMSRPLLSTSVVLVASMLSATPTIAAELTVEPRFAAGASYYDLDVKGEVVVGDDRVSDIAFSDWMYLVGGGLTFAYDRFFVDLYGQYSFDGQDTLNLDVVAGGVTVNDLAQDVKFDRIETTVTAGYKVTDHLATFVGFRYADAKFDGTGSLGGIAADFSTDFNQKGPFVGLGYVLPTTIFDGVFVANAAVAYLDGKLDNRLDVSAPLNDVAFEINGDAIGINAGASWVTSLTSKLKLVIGADVSHYSFKDQDDQTDFNELITRLRTELRYNFDVGPLGQD